MPVAEPALACPICLEPDADEPMCAACGWTLSSGWILGALTPAIEQAFAATTEQAQRRFDLAAAARAAGFPEAGDGERLQRLEAQLRGGPPEPGEREAT